MFSGGLDSRLAIKIMQKQGFDVLAVFFKLPFGTGCCNEGCSFNFSQLQGIKLKVFDCTKGKLLKEYLEVIREAKHGTGAGVNPCIDCRIFMLKHVKKFADKEKIKFIATGEVLGQRPMSQQKSQIKIIEKQAGLQGRIIRPLIDFEKIQGRSRKKQMALAKKFNIKYPGSGGGCLLCEKALKNRLEVLLKRGLNEKEIELVGVGRHFVFGKNWIVIGRNEKENKIIESSKAGKIIEPDYPAPSSIIMSATPTPPPSTKQLTVNVKSPKLSKVNNKKISQATVNKVNKLIQSYSKKGSLKEREKFDKWKL